MARRNEHNLVELKAIILNAAETIITTEGLAALTIRKIAMEMGYTVGSIYMVFASRAELILHINARTLEDITTYLQPINATADIETWLKAYLHYARTNVDRWRMIFTPHPPEAEPLPDWYQAQLNTIFQQFAPHFPQSPQAIQALWQGIHGICLLSSNDEVETAVLLLLRIFLRGWQSDLA
ncbi:MAG: TetR/AcrR family transcriptional regulator [Methylococcales bacterium]|nr:TetR/AcrR family transcriptional regulator [Methylococcales bacterium]